MNDYMIDIETTGLDPSNTAILQIAGVRFDFETQEIDNEFFNYSLEIPGNRNWDRETLSWWEQQGDVLGKITKRQSPPEAVLSELTKFAVRGGGSPIFWSKSVGFDYMFISSYYKQFNKPNPFRYWDAVEMNSFMKGGLGKSNVNIRSFSNVEFDGEAHNAIHDCLKQIKILFNYKETKDQFSA